MLQYTIWRFLIFGAFFALLALLGVEPLWAVVGAALASMFASLFLLRRQREEVARGLEKRVERGRQRREERLASERTDEIDEDEEIEGR